MDNKYSDNIIKQYIAQKVNFDSFCQNIEDIIRKLLKAENINIYSLTSRVKTVKSLENKLMKKGKKYKTISDITDIAGIRIITYYSDQVDIIARIIEQEFEVDKMNTIDKRVVIDPDRFGYVSLHYIVSLNDVRRNLREYEQFKNYKAEIQIRTILQHAWADIEHDLGYKTKNTIPKNIQRDFSRLSGLLELADKEFLSIRNYLSEYQDYVSENINRLDQKILIDKISLLNFLNSNQNIKKLNQQIAGFCDSSIKASDSIDSILEYLQLLEIKTISELDKVLSENIDLAYYIAKKMLEGEKESWLYDTIGLFYLFYAIISKTKNVYEISSVLNKTNIDFADERLNFAIDLSKYYNSFKNKN